MSQITLNLPDKVADDLAAASRDANQSPETFAAELVRRALSVRQLQQAHSKLVKQGEASGFKKDEDVFKAIS
jgi:hypothetical protein